MEFFGYASEAVRVETRVEIHGQLHQEDNSEDGPFLPLWEGVAQFTIAIL